MSGASWAVMALSYALAADAAGRAAAAAGDAARRRRAVGRDRSLFGTVADVRRLLDRGLEPERGHEVGRHDGADDGGARRRRR